MSKTKKYSKMSLAGFILALVSLLSFVVVCFIAKDSDDYFIIWVLWSIIGFWVAQAAHNLSEIGIILCAVKKKKGIALSIVGILICKIVMFISVIIFFTFVFHESPPVPAQGIYT